MCPPSRLGHLHAGPRGQNNVPVEANTMAACDSNTCKHLDSPHCPILSTKTSDYEAAISSLGGCGISFFQALFHLDRPAVQGA